MFNKIINNRVPYFFSILYIIYMSIGCILSFFGDVGIKIFLILNIAIAFYCAYNVGNLIYMSLKEKRGASNVR